MTIAFTQPATMTVGQVLDTMDKIVANPRQHLHDEEALRFIAAATEFIYMRDAFTPTQFSTDLYLLWSNAHAHATTPQAAANCLCLAAVACVDPFTRRDAVKEAACRDTGHTLAGLLLSDDPEDKSRHLIDNTGLVVAYLHQGNAPRKARMYAEESRKTALPFS